MRLSKAPRPVRLGIKGTASLAVLIGWPILVGNIAYTAYDVVTLDGCAKGWLQIQDDYKIAAEHTPPSADPMVVAGYLAENEHSLESRAQALICPHAVQDEQADFLAANRVYSSMLDVVSHSGFPADEANQQLLFFQLHQSGQAAGDAQDDFTRSLTAEYAAQHPEAAR